MKLKPIKLATSKVLLMTISSEFFVPSASNLQKFLKLPAKIVNGLTVHIWGKALGFLRVSYGKFDKPSCGLV